MVTIETVVTVTEEGTITAKASGYLSQGEHRDLASFRDSLDASRYPGNTILEMRERERGAV